MDTNERQRSGSRGRRFGAVLLSLASLTAACSGGDGAGDDDLTLEHRDPNRGPLPTLAGGIDLEIVLPARVLVAVGLSFGSPLPSEQAAAHAFTESPEVSGAVARRLYGNSTGRLVGSVTVLALDGSEIFDEGVLEAFVRGVIGGMGGGRVAEVDIGDRPTYRSTDPARTLHGFREGNLLVVVSTLDADDATLVVTRQIEAIRAGEEGAADPVTPLIAVPVDSVFVDVPALSFEPFAPEEEGAVPEAPLLAGATAVEGRYGVVAGERRTVVWSLSVDPSTYGSAEALEPAMAQLAAARAGGAESAAVEVVDRVVQSADGGPDQPSVRAFRHLGLVVLVEGQDAAQVDAVTSGWIQRLWSLSTAP